MDAAVCAGTESRSPHPSTHFAFAYGSLISPASAHRTLPGLDERSCLPARCAGMHRTFGVAFPNDGSQSDKWYADDSGHRTPRILFANLEPAPATAANGILLPVSRAGLDRLRRRELRYDAVDVTARVRLWDGGRPSLPVIAFIGKPEFTRPADVAAGLVPFAYLEAIRAGVRFWDSRARGFAAAYAVSTREPPPERVRSLTRFDRTATRPWTAEPGPS